MARLYNIGLPILPFQKPVKGYPGIVAIQQSICWLLIVTPVVDVPIEAPLIYIVAAVEVPVPPGHDIVI
jgi:hypothetical protein